ncbi:MAG: hypothetical protein F4058_04530 [Rhodothermaceae bacterium]|nr:hypothetical protein [Rhodothermaceae bacterium]MYF63909.1 hypothetical protein [Rhodothermaceae bacterium]MYI84586.1 hypothetical protein [Rhodothermaceae bacterium]
MEETTQNRTSSDVREALSENERQMEQHLGAIRHELMDVVSPVKEIIMRHPIGSTCAIMGLGVALGYLMGSERRTAGSGSGRTLLDAALVPVVEAVRVHLEESRALDREVDE